MAALTRKDQGDATGPPCPDAGADSQLADLRRQVDDIDEAMVGLINRRMELVRQIGGRKRQNATPVYDPQREQQVLERLTALNDGPLSNAHLGRIFGAIMAVARDVQQQGEVETQVKGEVKQARR